MAFCENCGTQLSVGAAFCPNCGSAVQAATAQVQPATRQTSQQQAYQQPANQPAQQAYQQPMQQDYQQQPNQQQATQQPMQQPYQQQPNSYAAPAGATQPEYQKLGGWLLFFVVVEAISILSYAGTLFSSLESLGSLSSLGGAHLMVGIVSLLTTIVGLVYSIGFIVFVVKRNPIFLWFYQVLGLAAMALALVDAIASATLISASASVGVATSAGISGLVVGIACLVLFTMYFCKSKRVRTYMGSTEYIDRALFKIGA